MSGETPLTSQLPVLALALLLAVCTAASYPVTVVVEIAAATALLVIAFCWLLGRRLSDTLSATTGFTLLLSVVVTVHAIAAHGLHGPSRALDRTPGYVWFARLLHYLGVVAILLAGRKRERFAALGAAAVCTSVFYTPTFATPEAAPPFVPLAALALVLLLVVPLGDQVPWTAFRDWRFVSLLAFVGLAALATLFSYSPQDSLTFLYKLLVLLVFTLAVPLIVRTSAEWRQAALLTIILSIIVPTLLSAIKLITLAWQLGGWAALNYRVSLNELGRSNLISRSLITGAPLLIAWVRTQARPRHGTGWWALGALALVCFAACRSWTGWIGLGVGCAFLGVLVGGRRGLVRRRRGRVGWYLLCAVGIALVGAGFLGLWRLAPRVNVRSFYGRQFQFRATFNEILDHPVLGVGPGHYFLKSKYTAGLDWPADARVTLDSPLMPVWWERESSRLHTHNLFLELAAGTGVTGLAAFAWFLFELLRRGLRMRAGVQGQHRILVTGCLTGIVASLGWGLIDVMEVSPPFFTFPTWMLIGLLLAAPRAFGAGDEQSVPVTPTPPKAQRVPYGLGPAARVLWGALAVVVVAMPLLGNLLYRAAYTAFRERRWTTAVERLAWATRCEPLNAHYHQLRGEALINAGRYDEAVSAYERAVRLRRDFAPYHAQLGWLDWLRGDPLQASAHLEQAVEMDPREAWRDGLHADLGLAYVAQGQIEDAVWQFKTTMALDPRMARAPYWLAIPGAEGRLTVVLDPIYAAGGGEDAAQAGDLSARALAHLGRADYGPQHFTYDADGTTSLAFDHVLDAIERDFTTARAMGRDDAPRLLAILADAVRFAGLHRRAEQAYVLYQELHPRAAYGFRELGSLYAEQGRLQEAQAMLECAVEVSPRDSDAWCDLVAVYLEQEDWQTAGRALEAMHRLMPLDACLYVRRAELYQEQGNLTRAADALRKALLIEETFATRLDLADIYWRLGRSQAAGEQCIQAAGILLREWPRPLAPELWDVGRCLVWADEEDPARAIGALARERPLLGSVLAGHTYRARGDLDQALVAYRHAATIHPDEPSVSYLLGETYQAMGRSGQAAAEYRRAAHLDPADSLPLLALGRLQWSEGQEEAALESFRAAVDVTPGSGPAQVALGNALLTLGERDTAAEHYQLARAAERAVYESTVYDFVAHLAEATIELPDPDYVRGDYFNIDGDQRRVIFAHPDARIRYSLAVDEGSALVFSVATAPGSWDQPGDGVDFAVYVEAGQVTHEAFHTYVDPKHNLSDQRWHAHEVDLSPFAGQMVNIVFQTSAGAAGDYQFDWAGWGEPRLERRLRP